MGANTATIHEPVDLPRNQQGRALIGDPRNDVHVIVAQMHLAFARFHNAVVDHLRKQFFPEGEVVDEARGSPAGTTSGSSCTTSCGGSSATTC